MIKNIIFDLGNVLLSFKPKQFILQYTTDVKRIDSFFNNIIASDTWLELDRGTISIENAKSIFISQYPEEKDLILPFFDHWMEMLTPIQANIKILRELKQNEYKVFALSNFIREAFIFVDTKYEFLSLFDGKIISSEEKVVKPEKEIYEILIHRYNLIPKECVYIDDYPFILEPAEELGMYTILYRQEIDLRLELRKLKIKI